MRTGISNRCELRLGLDGWQIPEERDAGLGDAELNAKVTLGEASGIISKTAILLAVSLPTGDDEFISNCFDPMIKMIFAHSLTDNLSLDYNIAL